MQAEVVSLEKGDIEGIYHATLKIHDDKYGDEELLREALERSVLSLNAIEVIKSRMDVIGERAKLLYTTTMQREQEPRTVAVG